MDGETKRGEEMGGEGLAVLRVLCISLSLYNSSSSTVALSCEQISLPRP